MMLKVQGFICHVCLSTRGIKLMFSVGHISIMDALLKGQCT